MSCSDIDECKIGSDVCHQEAECKNTLGSFSCDCKPGYTGDGKICYDIDECKEGSHVCHQGAECKNTLGSYSCNCKPGYTGDGKSSSEKSANSEKSATVLGFVLANVSVILIVVLVVVFLLRKRRCHRRQAADDVVEMQSGPETLQSNQGQNHGPTPGPTPNEQNCTQTNADTQGS
ncbi:pro-epidermal growth factor-like [Dendronephthya gigantea]|uniref:pro-epidermal growth factor-like n=1 Tax=Dendronephthya gigantea TaxID=151771 RepID=UPI001068E31D|nr:pro-epidermal growth factor-like [Dendronephthya gigantea]